MIIRLLIITQQIDKNDPVMGFFHNWIKEFSSVFEKITVICLKKGAEDLPDNVNILSLGKEEGLSKFGYVIRFYKYIWSERENYNAVFIHMNQEYVLLGGLIWKFLNKRVVMWRNHLQGNYLTKIAVALSDKVFCTSEKAFVANFKKAKLMPVGIDTKIFSRDRNIERKKGSILFLSRISPVKKLELILEAFYILDKQNINFGLSIIGDPTSRDEDYYKKIRHKAFSLERVGKVIFSKGIPNADAPKVFNKHELFINATQIGSFDKTILEAMACECLPITSNTAVKNIIPNTFLFKEEDPIDLADKLKFALSLNEEEKKKFRQFEAGGVKKHNLENLTSKLFKEISNLV